MLHLNCGTVCPSLWESKTGRNVLRKTWRPTCSQRIRSAQTAPVTFLFSFESTKSIMLQYGHISVLYNCASLYHHHHHHHHHHHSPKDLDVLQNSTLQTDLKVIYWQTNSAISSSWTTVTDSYCLFFKRWALIWNVSQSFSLCWSSLHATPCSTTKVYKANHRIQYADFHLRKLLWVYCPGHAGVKGNDRADRLGGKATLTNGLLLGRSKVLRSLGHYLLAQSRGHHTIDCLEERGVERGSARRSSLKGRERAIVNQTNIGTVSKVTLGKRLRDGVERIWAFPSTEIPSWTELNWTQCAINRIFK